MDKATPQPWQQSYYVDHQQYADASAEWRDERRREERLIIRGAGVVGSPECNILFRIAGTCATEANAALIVRAVNSHDDLVQALGAALEALAEGSEQRNHIERIGRAALAKARRTLREES